ncbi:hypothetical protein Droror1_Dr00005091 [Drosera rotundifolia]
MLQLRSLLQCRYSLCFNPRFSHVAVSASLLCSEGAISSVSDNISVVEQKSKPPVELTEPALIRLKKERDPEKLFELFKANAQNRLVVENKYAFEDTVSRLAGAGKYHYIEELLEQQKSLTQGRREGFIIRVMMLYGMAGMTKQALGTFYDMHLYGCKRTVKSLNAALKVLAQTRDLAAISSFIREVPVKYEIQLDIISVNIVIGALCGMDIIDKAYMVLLEMERLGVRADVVTYTTLISASYKNGQWVIANGLWNRMLWKGCHPNIFTFNARIQFLVSRSRAWDANDLLMLMECVGIRPDEVTYNLVIKGFCKADNLDMAKRVYSAFLGRGYKPNVRIYQTMVHYLCEVGEFNLAYTMCKDCMKKNWSLNVDTVGRLIEGLKNCGNPHKARQVLMLAERRHPPFPRIKLDAFRSILGTS